MTRAINALASVTSIVILAGCQDSGGPNPPAVASIIVSPTDTTVLEGSHYSLSVTALDNEGAGLAVQPSFSYVVDNTDIVAVDASGRVSTLHPGTARITVNVTGGGAGTAHTAVVRVGRDIGT